MAKKLLVIAVSGLVFLLFLVGTVWYFLSGSAVVSRGNRTPAAAMVILFPEGDSVPISKEMKPGQETVKFNWLKPGNYRVVLYERPTEWRPKGDIGAYTKAMAGDPMAMDHRLANAKIGWASSSKFQIDFSITGPVPPEPRGVTKAKADGKQGSVSMAPPAPTLVVDHGKIAEIDNQIKDLLYKGSRLNGLRNDDTTMSPDGKWEYVGDIRNGINQKITQLKQERSKYAAGTPPPRAGDAGTHVMTTPDASDIRRLVVEADLCRRTIGGQVLSKMQAGKYQDYISDAPGRAAVSRWGKVQEEFENQYGRENLYRVARENGFAELVLPRE